MSSLPVSIVRLKFQGERFELAAHKHLLEQFRAKIKQKEENNDDGIMSSASVMDEVTESFHHLLVDPHVFSNAGKKDFQRKTVVEKAVESFIAASSSLSSAQLSSRDQFLFHILKSGEILQTQADRDEEKNSEEKFVSEIENLLVSSGMFISKWTGEAPSAGDLEDAVNMSAKELRQRIRMVCKRRPPRKNNPNDHGEGEHESTTNDSTSSALVKWIVAGVLAHEMVERSGGDLQRRVHKLICKLPHPVAQKQQDENTKLEKEEDDDDDTKVGKEEEKGGDNVKRNFSSSSLAGGRGYPSYFEDILWDYQLFVCVAPPPLQQIVRNKPSLAPGRPEKVVAFTEPTQDNKPKLKNGEQEEEEVKLQQQNPNDQGSDHLAEKIQKTDNTEEKRPPEHQEKKGSEEGEIEGGQQGKQLPLSVILLVDSTFLQNEASMDHSVKGSTTTVLASSLLQRLAQNHVEVEILQTTTPSGVSVVEPHELQHFSSRIIHNTECTAQSHTSSFKQKPQKKGDEVGSKNALVVEPEQSTQHQNRKGKQEEGLCSASNKNTGGDQKKYSDDEHHLERLSPQQLQEMCRQRKLSTSGKKLDLIDRLEEYFACDKPVQLHESKDVPPVSSGKKKRSKRTL